MACNRGKGASVPITAAVWQETLLLGRAPVNAGREHRLHRRRYLDGLAGTAPGGRPPAPRQRAGLHQGADALLQEEGIPFGTLDEEGLEGCQAGVAPQERVEEFVGIRRRQRVESDLGIVGFAPQACWYSGR